MGTSSPVNVSKSTDPQQKWPWWGWIILFALLVVVSYGSYFLRNFTDSILLYLPTPFSIILIYWFGPRMLPLIYVNEVITLILWGASGGWLRIALLALHAPVSIFSSWFFYKRQNKEVDQGLFHSTHSFVRFVLLGIFLPVLINSAFTYQYTFVNGNWEMVILMLLADFITILAIATPILYFVVPDGHTLKLTIVKPLVHDHQHQFFGKESTQLLGIVIVFISMAFFVDFNTYWFLYGMVSIIVAIRNGFAAVIFVNCVIFLLDYILPLLDFADVYLASKGSGKLLHVHLGMATMMLSSSLIGRVISDLWKARRELIDQKAELQNTNAKLTKTNSELDRFVYSLSHDISAPLKSIKGLVHLSRLDKITDPAKTYLAKIDGSVDRLESFIRDLLNYSRSTRKDIHIEELCLETLAKEISEDLRYSADPGSTRFIWQLEAKNFRADKFLLKVALSNLIGNAIKYQKKSSGHDPFVRVASKADDKGIWIAVEDNGEGIPPEYQEHVFEMFYRGTSTSTGSGLGLYIARESILKMKGEITVQSQIGQGSTFTIFIPPAD